MRVFAYLRVSTGRQEENQLSIPDQRRAVTAYCEKRGWEIVEEFAEPRSATSDRRPKFQEMIDLATAPIHPVEAILVYNYSRFFRDWYGAETYVRRLKGANVTLISVTQETGEDPSGQLMRTIINVFDEYSSRQTGRTVSDCMKANARSGFWNGSRPPFGYRTQAVAKKGSRTKKVLVLDETEASVVRLMRDLLLGRFPGLTAPMGIKKVAAFLNENGIAHRGRIFYGGAVHKIFRGTAIKGEHVCNRRTARGVDKPKEEWVTMKVPSIILS